jgi:hypothetical protein
MKVPLKYQSTDYDCAPTTMVNALNYLLDREDIQPELIKTIYAYSLDRFDGQGNTCRGGTSKIAVQLIANWINTFSQTRACGIRCDFLNCDDIDLSNSRLTNHLANGGVMLACVYYENAVFHYVLVTTIDEDYVYLFDPYYNDSFAPDDAFEIIGNEPFKANRKVRRQRFNSSDKSYYALGERSKRECVLMEKSR